MSSELTPLRFNESFGGATVVSLFAGDQIASSILLNHDPTKQPVSLIVNKYSGLRFLNLPFLSKFSTSLKPPDTSTKRHIEIYCTTHSLTNCEGQNWSLLDTFNQFLLFEQRVSSLLALGVQEIIPSHEATQ